METLPVHRLARVKHVQVSLAKKKPAPTTTLIVSYSLHFFPLLPTERGREIIKKKMVYAQTCAIESLPNDLVKYVE